MEQTINPFLAEVRMTLSKSFGLFGMKIPYEEVFADHEIPQKNAIERDFNYIGNVCTSMLVFNVGQLVVHAFKNIFNTIVVLFEVDRQPSTQNILERLPTKVTNEEITWAYEDKTVVVDFGTRERDYIDFIEGYYTRKKIIKLQTNYHRRLDVCGIEQGGDSSLLLSAPVHCVLSSLLWV